MDETYYCQFSLGYMGYTHYFQFKCESINKEKFADAVNLFKKCFSKVEGVKLGNGVGNGDPIITPTSVCFNGWAENDEDYETFSLNVNDTEWNFCKTARQPYDIAVCLCLLCFKKVFGDEFSYSSDGTTRERIAEPTDYMKKYSAETGYVYKVEEEWQKAYDIFDAVVAE